MHDSALGDQLLGASDAEGGVDSLGGAEHGLGGDAGPEMALAADELVFDDEDGEGALFGSADCEDSAGGPAAEDDEVVFACGER